MQRTRDFVIALFFSLSCIPTLCSCCTTQPCFDMIAWFGWLSVEATSLMSFHSLGSFLPILEWFCESNTSCVLYGVSAVVCVKTQQKTPLMSSHLNSFSQFFRVFSLRCRRLNQLSASLLGGKTINIRIEIRTVGSFFRMGTRACNRRGCTSSKERANIHVFMEIFDPPNLANYKIKKPSA